VAAGLVGAVLLLAGGAKIAGSVALPGLPRWLGSVLPYVELAVGALVLAGFWPAGVAALVLLAGFTGWLVRQLARGDRRPCRCFGETGGHPVGPWSIGRNVLLMAAVTVAVAGADGPPGWTGRLLGAVLGGLLVLIESGLGRTSGRGADAAG
jgi:methylamine utilization protein MauE